MTEFEWYGSNEILVLLCHKAIICGGGVEFSKFRKYYLLRGMRLDHFALTI